nr:tetratricopeptide repeat protein [Deltaproteobacteria bacterium]
TSIREEQSPRVLDLRMRCLGRATQDLQAVVDLLEDADAAVVDKAAQLAATLPPLSWCEDIESLEATVEPPQPEDANAVDTARHHLARAKSLRTTQRDEPASAAVTAAAAALEGVSYGPVNTELMLERGRVHTSLTEYDAAKDALHEALALALQWNQRSLAAEAAVRLVHLVGHLQLHPEAVASLEPVALGLAQGDVHAEITARMFIVEIHEQDQWDEAEQEYRRLLAVAEATPDIQPLLVSRIRDSLAYACLSTGKYAEAEAEYRSVLALAEQVQGSDHPKVARIRGRLGDALTLQGKLEEAEAELSRALVVVERALGADHLDVAVVHMQRGIVLHTQGRFEAAEAEYLTCMPTMLRVLGPKHPNIASARHNLANTLGGLGRHAEAEAEHRAGLAVRLEAFGPDHLQVAYSRSDLAQALERQGKLDEAVAEARAAVAVLERTVSPGHPNIASIRENLARMLRAQGKDEQADEVIEGPSAP